MADNSFHDQIINFSWLNSCISPYYFGPIVLLDIKVLGGRNHLYLHKWIHLEAYLKSNLTEMAFLWSPVIMVI